MTTLNTTEDLLRVARANPEFREQFRRLILTEELMAVPDDIKELRAVTANLAVAAEALLEHASATNQRLNNIDERISRNHEHAMERMRGIDEQIASLVQGMADYKTATENRFAEVQASISRVEGTVREQEQAQSSFRGTYAQATASAEDLDIARKFSATHGLELVPINTIHIGRTTLRMWIRTHGDTLPTLDLKGSNPLDKFVSPDLVAAIADDTVEDATPAYYITVEASYSGEKKDVDKATDNAKIVQAITGLKAYPVVAAVRLHHRMDRETRSRLYEDVEDFIRADNPDAALWHKIDADDMWPPEPR